MKNSSILSHEASNYKGLAMRWSLDKKLSLFLLFLGVIMMSCWIFGQPTLYRLYPKIYIQVFNTSLIFTLLGLILLLPDQKFFLKIQIIAALFIISISVIILIQSFIDTKLGIDQFFLKVIIDLPVENPGRMSRQTASCFLLTGISLCLLQNIRTRRNQYFAFSLMAIIFVVGFIGLLGDLLHLNIIYDWQRYGRMAPHTAIGLMILATILSMKLCIRAREYDSSFPDKKMTKNCLIISLVAFFWLGGTAFLAVLININKLTGINANL